MELSGADAFVLLSADVILVVIDNDCDLHRRSCDFAPGMFFEIAEEVSGGGPDESCRFFV